MAEQLFVDSSVIVAILLEEPNWPRLAERLEGAQRRVTSPVALLEVAIRLSHSVGDNPASLDSDVRDFLESASIEIMAIGDRVATAAIDAFTRYGKGRHSARLNLGDCFSYACAREAGLTPFYIGNDFAQTDLA